MYKQACVPFGFLFLQCWAVGVCCFAVWRQAWCWSPWRCSRASASTSTINGHHEPRSCRVRRSLSSRSQPSVPYQLLFSRICTTSPAPSSCCKYRSSRITSNTTTITKIASFHCNRSCAVLTLSATVLLHRGSAYRVLHNPTKPNLPGTICKRGSAS